MPVENEDKKKEEDFSLELQRRTDENAESEFIPDAEGRTGLWFLT